MAQLDQNRFNRDSMDSLTRTVEETGRLTYDELRNLQFIDESDAGFRTASVQSSSGKPLPHTIVGTLMRIDLPQPLEPGKSIRFSIEWSYQMVDSESADSSRDGYEHFPADGNDIFLMAQWYPRVVAYSDYEGWHNKEFVGRGEFTLEFGDFDVSITVPADHIVSSTGVLQNPDDVLSSTLCDGHVVLPERGRTVMVAVFKPGNHPHAGGVFAVLICLSAPTRGVKSAS